MPYEEIEFAINSLNKNKRDGSAELNSNHIIFSFKEFKLILTDLFNSLLSHGYNPDEILKAVLVSIPKDLQKNLCDSENYRGIALCSALAKLWDIIIINKFNNNLNSSNLQFAFKGKHSTTMCTAIFNEIIAHYTDNGSNVYACLLDASKAFDRVSYIKLFRLLLERDIPPIYVRLLINLYKNQITSVEWDRKTSRSFKSKNGVRQGAILSPILFNIYIDETLKLLKERGVGCYIGNHYAGALGYADDITLICPSLDGLQEMIETCEFSADIYAIKFNSKKSQCIKFSKLNGNDIPFRSMYINQAALPWCGQVKHLGHIIQSNLSQEKEITFKKGCFIGSVNKLFSKFSYIPSRVMSKLFRTYCSSFYGSQWWDLNSYYLLGLYTTWNKAVRKILKLPYQCHTRYLPSLINQEHLKVQLQHRFVNFIKMFCLSDNPLVHYISEIATKNFVGIIGKNWKCIYVNNCHNIESSNTSNDVFNFSKIHSNLSDMNINCEYEQEITFIKELILIRDGDYQVPILNKSEINDIIDYFACA